jgi:hypothetical protein
MTRFLPIAASLLLVGCGGQGEVAAPPSNDAAEAAPATAAKVAVPLLEGNWRVMSITGTPTTGSALTATIGNGRAELSAGCLRRAWTYTQDRNTVDFVEFSVADCDRMPSSEEDMAFVALGDANLAIFGKGGRDVTLSGSGGTLSLQRR